MTKSDLIAKFADRYPRLLGKDAEAAVNAVLDAIAMTMVKGERTEIRGFGSFTIKH